MSMPNIDDITASFTLDFKEIVKLLAASVALEEIGLSHIINAEGEKMQDYLLLEGLDKNDYLKLNDKVIEFLKYAAEKEATLAEKLATVKEFLDYIAEYYTDKKLDTE